MVVHLKCECGRIVSGTSQSHAKENIKIHRKSNKHKQQIGIISSQALVTEVKHEAKER